MNADRHFFTLFRRGFAVLLMYTFLSGDGAAVVGSELSQRWEGLREKFEAASLEIRSKFEKDRSELGERFVGALQKLETGLQEKGALEDLLAVQEEREGFIKSGVLGSAERTDVKRLRTVYLESRAPIDAGEKEGMGQLRDAYLKQLETLQGDLTRAGEIETAVMVKTEADRLRSGIADDSNVAAPVTPVAATSETLARLAPIPSIAPAPVDAGVFKLEQWPPQMTLPQGNYRVEGTRTQGSDLGREVILSPGSVFRGTDKKALWLIGRATLVAREVMFDGFTFEGDLSSQLFFEKCHFKDMNLGKGGGWVGGRFMTRWQFRDCRIEGSFAQQWNSKRFGLQMVNCQVERVEFPSIEYDKDDEPSAFASQDWAMVRNTHFRKCVIPVSVLSILEDCSFEACRFIDDPSPLTFATKITRTIFLEDCQWNVKALPAEFIVEQKKMSERP